MIRKARHGAQSNIGYYGDFVSRLLAFVLDAVTISVSFTILLWLISVTASTMQIRAILGFSLKQFPQVLDLVDRLANPEALAAWAGLYMLAYHIFFTTLTGQTIGKAFLGLRVVTIEGKRLSLWRAILRLAGFFMAVSIVFLGLLWVIVDNRRQGLHDKIAGTYVIYTWDAVPDEQFLADEIVLIASRSNRGASLHGQPPRISG